MEDHHEDKPRYPSLASVCSSSRLQKADLKSLHSSEQSVYPKLSDGTAAIQNNNDSSLQFDSDFLEQQASMLREYQDKKSRPPSTTRDDTKLSATEEVNEEHQSDVDLTTMLNDSDLVEEQRRIYHEIQRRGAESHKAPHQQLLQRTAKPPPVAAATAPATAPALSQQGYFNNIVSRRGLQGKQGKDITREEVMDALNDSVKHFGNGRKVRVKGMRQAYDSVARGTAILVQCPCCNTYLQVDRSAKAVYCICCHQVVPMDAATGGSSPSSHDADVARLVQSQEHEIAHARKTASSASGSTTK
jgi:hypothetical protein